jgi:hypothetical protein
MTIAGINMTVAASVLSAIGEIARFASAEQISRRPWRTPSASSACSRTSWRSPAS